MSLRRLLNPLHPVLRTVVGSELIQKYLGDGPKLVRELFRVADELAPSIVFIGVCACLPSLVSLSSRDSAAVARLPRLFICR